MVEAGAVAVLTALALGLRIHELGAKSFWLDEVLTAQSLRYDSLAGVLTWKRQLDLSLPPLSFFLTWLFRPFGESELVIRLPEALAGAATIPAIYMLGKAIVGVRIGMTAALLMAVLPFSVEYGQEARPYALLMLLTTLQMLYAYRVTTSSRRRDWVAFVLSSTANLYTHYLAFAPLFASYVYIGLALAIQAGRASRAPATASAPVPTWRARMKGPALAAGATVLLYAPWGLDVIAFLRRPDLGFGRLGGDVDGPVVALGQALLRGVSFEGPLLALLAVGLVALATRAVRRRGDLPSLLVLLWIGAPLGVLVLRAGFGIVALLPRYLSFVFPAFVIAAAVGIEAIAGLLRGTRRWWGDRRASSARAGAPAAMTSDVYARVVTAVAYVALIVTVLADAGPRLAAVYNSPKDDYRGAAALIAQSSLPDAAVIAVGQHSGFAVIGLRYYLTRSMARVRVLDGAGVDDRLIEELRSTRGPLWAAVFHGPSGRVSEDGLHVHRLHGITIARWRESRPDSRDPIAAAAAFLQWAGAFYPPQAVSRSIFEALAIAEGTPPRDNILPPPSRAFVEAIRPVREHWTLLPGSSIEGQAILLGPRGASTNAVFETARLQPGEKYIMRFSYENADLHGPQRVYVSAHDVDGRWLDIFPTGAGYPCERGDGWKSGAFGFGLPPNAAYAVVWLRASGTGSAKFRDVEVKQIAETGTAPPASSLGPRAAGGAAGGPTLVVSPSRLRFDPATAERSTVEWVTLSNGGSADLRIGQMTVRGDDTESFRLVQARDECSGKSLRPGEACRVGVKLRRRAGGSGRAVLVIPNGEGDRTVALETTSVR